MKIIQQRTSLSIITRISNDCLPLGLSQCDKNCLHQNITRENRKERRSNSNQLTTWGISMREEVFISCSSFQSKYIWPIDKKIYFNILCMFNSRIQFIFNVILTCSPASITTYKSIFYLILNINTRVLYINNFIYNTA